MRRLRQYGTAALALVLFALLANKYYLSIAVFAGINATLAIGLNLLLGFGGQVSLGHAAFFGIGAYGAGILSLRCGCPTWLSIPAAMCLAAIVAYAIGVPTLRLKGHYLAMATLGFGIIVQIVLVELPGLTGGPSGLIDIPPLAFGSIEVKGDRAFALIAWGLILLLQAALANLRGSRAGRALLAINDNEEAAASLGVNTAKIKQEVFVVSAVTAALAGALYAYYINFISPDTFGFSLSVEILTMAVVGGLGTVWGPVLGAALLTVVHEAFSAANDLRTVFYGLVLILAVAFLPNGLAGGGRKLARWAARQALADTGRRFASWRGRWRRGGRPAAS